MSKFEGKSRIYNPDRKLKCAVTLKVPHYPPFNTPLSSGQDLSGHRSQANMIFPTTTNTFRKQLVTCSYSQLFRSRHLHCCLNTVILKWGRAIGNKSGFVVTKHCMYTRIMNEKHVILLNCKAAVSLMIWGKRVEVGILLALVAALQDRVLSFHVTDYR
jgi:hypothetical protein